ncbi:MAG TPA: MerR family transcriptional regulator [Stellaceae bacterium]|nr:MerR family transcriptional regulator [Stellaceae bacterium]
MSGEGEPRPARPAKRPSAFRTIGEVAGDLDVPPHVLRFWEAKFPQLQPLKRGGGRRYYRPEDVALLRRIRQCLYQDGYTIRGVQRLLTDPPGGGAAPAEPRPAMPSLFPLDALSPAAMTEPPPARRPRRRPPAPQHTGDAEPRAALEAIRRDLLAARALVAELLQRAKKS